MSTEEQPQFRRRVFYFLRHGESANNANAHDDVQITQGETTPSSPSKRIKKERLPDPNLTTRGYSQGEICAEKVKALDVGQVWCSAMRRCVQTTSKAVGSIIPDIPVKVYGDLHEEGGLFHGTRAEQKDNPKFPIVHGSTVSEIKTMFPEGTKVSCYGSTEPDSLGGSGNTPSTSSTAVPRSACDDFTTKVTGGNGTCDGWWRGGFETIDQVQFRMEAVKQIMFEEVMNPTANPEKPVLIVSHGLFVDRLYKLLLHVPFDAPVFFLTANTGITGIQVECPINGDQSEARVALLFHNRTDHLSKEVRTGHSCGGFRLPPADI